MDGNSSIFNFKQFPRAFLLFLTLAASFEWGVHCLNRDHFAVKKELVESSPIRADVLFIGDSSLTRDLDIVRFEEVTGFQAYAYGTVRPLGVLSYYLHLRNYLRHQPSPRHVVIMTVPNTLSITVGRNYDRLFDFFFHADPDLFYVLEKGLSPTLFFRYFILSRLPSILHRAYLADLPFSDRRHVYEDAYKRLQNVRLDFLSNKGTRLLDDSGKGVQCLEQNQPDEYLLSTESRHYLGSILKLAASRGIQVFYATSPIAEECFDIPQIEQLGKANRAILTEYPEIIPLQPEVLTWPRKMFSDSLFHLNKTSARLFTERIANKMKAVLQKESP